MAATALEIGHHVYVISYGPFRGLRGVVKQIHTITELNAEELFCFYYVELEGAQINKPVWFQNHEVESGSAFLPQSHL